MSADLASGALPYSPQPDEQRKVTMPLEEPGRFLGALDILPRGVVVLLGIASGVVTLAGIRALSGIVGPVVLALMLTIAVHPLTVRMRDRGTPGWLATLIGLVGVYLIVLGIAVALVISAARLATTLPEYQDQFTALVDNAEAALTNLGVSSEQVSNAVSQIDPGRIASWVETFLGSALGLLSNLFFLVTLLLFMGMDAANFSDRLTEVSAPRTSVVEALRGFAQGTRSYLVVSTIFGAIVAVIDGLALWALGVPLPVLWALLSFVTNYIPNIGFVIGLIPPALLALLEGGPKLMLSVILTYSVINVIIQSVIQPKVIGDNVGLSTTMTFLSLVFWAWVLGPLGALLAVPLSLFTKALLVDIDPSSRWLTPLLSGKQVPSLPPAQDHEPVQEGEPA